MSYGAEGVGLCRTERMFFAPDRLFAMQCALLAVEDEQREHWLSKLEGAQRSDFARSSKPWRAGPSQFDYSIGHSKSSCRRTNGHCARSRTRSISSWTRSRRLRGVTWRPIPAFGHRGVRAGLTVPGLYDMQVRAMLLAAQECVERGTVVDLEVLIPMVAFTSEVVTLSTAFDRLCDQLLSPSRARCSRVESER